MRETLNRLRMANELKMKGVVNHLEQICFVKGCPELLEGSKVSLFHYQDRVTINDSTVIPFNRLINVETFRINEVSIPNKLRAIIMLLRWGWFKQILAMVLLISHRRVRCCLAIEFIDKQGCDCKSLFMADNLRSIKTFADGINRQINIFSEARSSTC